MRPLTEKLRGLVRGVTSGSGRGPDVEAGVAAGVIYLLLPAALGFDYRLLAPRELYQLMWLNLLGTSGLANSGSRGNGRDVARQLGWSVAGQIHPIAVACLRPRI